MSLRLKIQSLKIQQEIEEALAEAYGIEVYYPGPAQWKRRPDPSLLNHRIQYLWQAKVSIGLGAVIVSAIHLKRPGNPELKYMGVLLVPKDEDVPDRAFSGFQGENPMRAIRLTEPDRIMPLVNQVNFLAPNGDIIPDDRITLHFTLYAHTRIGKLSIDYLGDINEPSVQQLWDALQETIQQYRKLYNDPAVEKFFDRWTREF